MSLWYASAVGYFLRVISSSCASVYFPRGLNPLYQMSNGSSGRPSRRSISAATFGASGDVSTRSNMSRTRGSGNSRFSSNMRAMCVGAEGENGSMPRMARKEPSSISYRVFGSGALVASGPAAGWRSESLTSDLRTTFL